MPAAAMRAGPHAGVHRALERERQVAEPSPPPARGILLEIDRRDELDLASRPDAVFVDQVVSDGLLAATRERRHPDGLVLGKRLFGEERARQIQVAARPARAPCRTCADD